MLAMGDIEQESSKALLNIDPLARDNKLLINKDIRSLDDIRKSFKQEQSGNSVLNQVRNFLPQMASANDELQRQIAEDPEHSVDIEDIGDDEEAQHIEMNLALVEGIDCDDTTDSDCSSDDDDDDCCHGELNESNIKLPRQIKNMCNKKTLVTCLDNDTDNLNSENMDCADNEKT